MRVRHFSYSLPVYLLLIDSTLIVGYQSDHLFPCCCVHCLKVDDDIDAAIQEVNKQFGTASVQCSNSEHM